MRPVLLCRLLVALVLVNSGKAMASDSARSEGIPLAVLLVGADQNTRMVSFTRALLGQLREVDAHLEVYALETSLPAEFSERFVLAEGVAAKEDATVVFWVDFHEDNQVILYLSSIQGERVLVRKLGGEEPGQVDESLAVIVRSAVEAIHAGGEIGVALTPEVLSSMGTGRSSKLAEPAPKEDMANDPGQPSAATESDEGHVLHLQAAYGLLSHSEEAPLIHGGQIAVGVAVSTDALVFLGTRLSTAARVQTGDLDLVVRRYPILLGGSWFRSPGRWTIGGTAAVSLDIVRDTTEVSAEDASVVRRGTEVGMSGIATLDVGFRPARRLRFFLSAGMEIPIIDTDYLLETDGRTDVLIASWPVRPLFLFGVDLAVW